MSFSKRIRTALAAAGDKVTLDLGPLSRFPRAGVVEVYAAEDGTNEVEISGFSGTDQFMAKSEVATERVAGTGPIVPENKVGQGRGNAGDPIIIEVENISSPTAAAVVTTLVVVR